MSREKNTAKVTKKRKSGLIATKHFTRNEHEKGILPEKFQTFMKDWINPENQ